jgi:uncharacterized membrane protein
MSDAIFLTLTFATALGSAIVGGVYFGFSAFIMKALARLPPAHGIAAMQSINVTVITPWFLIPFIGTAIAAGALILVVALGWGDVEVAVIVVGAGLYLIGSFGVTIACNVPRNDELALVEPDSAAAVTTWRRYLPSWTAWNTVRTVASLGAAAMLMGGLAAG